MKKKPDIQIHGKKARLLYVEWLDIQSDVSWRTLSKVEKDEPKHCVTVGFEVVNTEEKLVLASSIGEVDSEDNEGLSDTTVIPKGCVKSIRVIE